MLLGQGGSPGFPATESAADVGSARPTGARAVPPRPAQPFARPGSQPRHCGGALGPQDKGGPQGRLRGSDGGGCGCRKEALPDGGGPGADRGAAPVRRHNQDQGAAPVRRRGPPRGGLQRRAAGGRGVRAAGGRREAALSAPPRGREAGRAQAQAPGRAGRSRDAGRNNGLPPDHLQLQGGGQGPGGEDGGGA